MNFTTYILYSKKLDKYYIGYTSDMDTRLIRHNQNSKGFTGRANDWEISFKRNFLTKTEAYAFERKIKSWKSRNKVVELIKKGLISSVGSEHSDFIGRVGVRIWHRPQKKLHKRLWSFSSLQTYLLL